MQNNADRKHLVVVEKNRHIQNIIGKTAQHCSFMWANGEKGCLNMGIFIPYYVH